MTITRRTLMAAGAAIFAPAPVSAQSDGFRGLEARRATTRIAPEPAAETEIWGFDGTTPGPVLRYRQGDEVKIRFVNRLDHPMAIHWGGVRIDNSMDGAPGLTQKPVPPGQSFDYRFTVPDAGTYWYHAASETGMDELTARGLCGLLIVEETEPPPAHREVIAVIQDWRLDPKGALETCSAAGRHSFSSLADYAGAGRIGGLVTCNRIAAPQRVEIEPGSRVRLRLANLANARIMAVTFEGFLPLVIGVDGQPCGAFEPVRRTLPVGPGARFDLLFDLPSGAGERAAIRMTGTDSFGGGPDRDLLAFDLKGAARPPLPKIVGPALNQALPPVIRLDKATRLDLNIEGGGEMKPACSGPGAPPVWRIKGKSGKALNEKPLFSVSRGTPVSLGFINKTRVAQIIRLHGHVLRQLHLLDDGWEPYWRDSVIVPPGKTVRVAFVADNPGKWRLAGGVMEHAVSGMWAWYEVK